MKKSFVRRYMIGILFLAGSGIALAKEGASFSALKSAMGD